MNPGCILCNPNPNVPGTDMAFCSRHALELVNGQVSVPVRKVRAVRFKVSGEMLRDVLHMPATARFLRAAASTRDDDTVEFVVEDPDIPESDTVWDTVPTVTHIRDGAFVWDWNVPSQDEPV